MFSPSISTFWNVLLKLLEDFHTCNSKNVFGSLKEFLESLALKSLHQNSIILKLNYWNSIGLKLFTKIALKRCLRGSEQGKNALGKSISGFGLKRVSPRMFPR